MDCSEIAEDEGVVESIPVVECATIYEPLNDEENINEGWLRIL